MKKPKSTRVDDTLNTIKNNKIFAIVIFLGIVVIAIGSFTDSLNKIKSLFSKKAQELDIRLPQFTIDEEKSVYRAFHYDSNRDIHPSGMITAHPDGKFDAYGKIFSSGEELESYSKKLLRETNHRLFGWLKDFGLNPQKVPLVIDKREEVRFSPVVNAEDAYPFFLISVQNDGTKQIVLNEASIKVHKVIPVLAVGVSALLDPVATYIIKIASKEGVYSQKLVPPIKVAANDAISLGIRILPLSNYQPKGKILIANLTLNWENGSIDSQRFMLYFED